MKLLFIYLLLTLIGPLAILLSGQIDFKADWRTANRESAHLAPDPFKTKEAVIQVYSARTFNWRGMFAVHTWLAIKPKNSEHYTVYHSIGWRLFMNLPPVVEVEDIPDRNWFNQKPTIILTIQGKQAEKLIPEIKAAVSTYPYHREYHYWPGPNSNTFIAYIARHVPGLGLAMPSNAVGKDFLPGYTFFTPAPSGTGYQLSLFGLFGILVAKTEGIEINILGVVYGISPSQHAIKLPGFGDIRLF